MIGFRSRTGFVCGRCLSDFPIVCSRCSCLSAFFAILFIISSSVDLNSEQYAHMHLFHFNLLAFSGRLLGTVFVMPFVDVLVRVILFFINFLEQMHIFPQFFALFRSFSCLRCLSVCPWSPSHFFLNFPEQIINMHGNRIHRENLQDLRTVVPNFRDVVHHFRHPVGAQNFHGCGTSLVALALRIQSMCPPLEQIGRWPGFNAADVDEAYQSRRQ